MSPEIAKRWGLKTDKDFEDIRFVMLQCRLCTKWTRQLMPESLMLLGSNFRPCTNCGKSNYDLTSATSIRSWNPAAKRKPRG